MKYMTVNQFKQFNDGVSLANVPDMTLAKTIFRAEAGIDAHMGFDAKRGGFEPHKVMLQSIFNENTRKTFIPNSQIPIRQVTRYRIQVSNITTSGAGFFANINSGDCVINNDGDYIEIVPLQAVTYALSPVILQLGLKPPIVELDCEVGFYIPIFGEQLIDDGSHQNYYALRGFWATTYTQSLATQPALLPPIPAVVYVNGVVQTTGYTINANEGSVSFTTLRAATDVVTADYTYVIPDYVTEACILQTSHILAQKALNEMKMYRGLYHMRSGEQEIGYPRSVNVAEKGRLTDTTLCDEAAGVLARLEDWAIA